MIINDLSIPEENIPFSKGSDVRLMGDHDDGNSQLLIETLKDSHDFRARLRIEIARGFVGQNNGRLVNQGTRNGDALLFTSGKLAGMMMFSSL